MKYQLEDLDLHIRMENGIVAISLGMIGEPEDPGHRIEHTTLHTKEMQEIPLHSSESTSPAMSVMNTVMRMKIRWEIVALPTGFVGLGYPKVSN
jgi:hypothetical protein